MNTNFAKNGRQSKMIMQMMGGGERNQFQVEMGRFTTNFKYAKSIPGTKVYLSMQFLFLLSKH